MVLSVEFVGDDPRASPHVCDVAAVLRASFTRIDNHPMGDWDVAILVTGGEEISRLHKRFFDDASDTDVMSFPSGDDLRARGGHLGDIAISLDVAAVQAEQQRQSLGRELSYLALHGLLHLLGFRDDDELERAAMLGIQDDLLAAWEHEQVGAG